MPEPDEMPSLSRPAQEETEESKLRRSMVDRARTLESAEKKLDDAEAKVRLAESERDEAARELAAKRSIWWDAFNAYGAYVRQHGTEG